MVTPASGKIGFVAIASDEAAERVMAKETRCGVPHLKG
jgi:hypothetical protein